MQINQDVLDIILIAVRKTLFPHPHAQHGGSHLAFAAVQRARKADVGVHI